MADLRNRIRVYGSRGMSAVIREGCNEMAKEYMKQNMDAIEKIWSRGDNNEKAKVWPGRFLYESFLANLGSSPDVLIV